MFGELSKPVFRIQISLNLLSIRSKPGGQGCGRKRPHFVDKGSVRKHCHRWLAPLSQDSATWQALKLFEGHSRRHESCISNAFLQKWSTPYLCLPQITNPFLARFWVPERKIRKLAIEFGPLFDYILGPVKGWKWVIASSEWALVSHCAAR